MQEVVIAKGSTNSVMAFPLKPDVMYAFPAPNQSFTPGERVVIVRGDERCEATALGRTRPGAKTVYFSAPITPDEKWFDQYRRVFATV